MCESAKCKRGRRATPSRQSGPLHAASGNVVNHIPTLTHTHLHTHTLTHIFMSRNSANVPNCPRHGHPAPLRPVPTKCVGGVGGRGKQFSAAAVFLFILFSVILLCDPSVDFMYLFMGKLGKWLSLHFPSLSRARPLRQGAKGYNYEVYTPFAQAGLPQRLHHFQLVRISFSDFQLAFLPRPISRSPLGFSTSHGL